jgi:nucleotide-binding universal stress UspA family protein
MLVETDSGRGSAMTTSTRPHVGDRPATAATKPRPAAATTAKPRPAAQTGGRVIVGIDDSPAGLAALRWAVERARSSGASLVAVRSWALGLPRHGGRGRQRLAHLPVVMYFGGSEQRVASAKLVRRAFATASGGLPKDVRVTVRTPEGDPGAALTRVAARPGDLIVLGGGHAPRWRRARHGSVSGYCLRHSNCPVVVVPADRDHRDPGPAGRS